MNKRTIAFMAIFFLLIPSTYATIYNVNKTENGTKARLYVDPGYVSLPVGETFTIYVKVEDIVDLYGVDIQLGWDETIIRYVSHQKYIPVEDYPDGVLHKPTVPVKDDVFEGSPPGTADPNSDYWLAEASMLPAEPFAGSGIVFEMTFEVVGVGYTSINITTTTLAAVDGSPIPVEIVDGEFNNGIHDIAVTDVSRSPKSVVAGEPVFVDVTVENLGNFLEQVAITAYYDGSVIDTRTDIMLDAGDVVVLRFEWDTTGVSPGTYLISASVEIMEGEDDNPENNFLEDDYVTVTTGPPPPPPITGKIQVEWSNYSGYPDYPFGGQYHNGEYPVWKNFTIVNGFKDDSIVYISVKYPETSPAFKPAEYLIQTVPNEQCWTIKVNLDDRLIEFIAEDEGILPGGYGIVSIKFIEGPTAEDCSKGHEFAITVSCGSCYSKTFYLTEYIDKTPPSVKITFPAATDPKENYAFIKRNDGYIWLLLPNSTNRKYDWLWINGTASDFCSGINRVEIWINGTYMGDATLSGPVGSKKVSWWWRTDPTKNLAFWKKEHWYYVIARAYDNSVNNEKTIPPHGGHPELPLTNYQDTVKHWFFWIGREGPVVTVCQDHKPLDWVPGNGRVDVWGETGFYPNTDVEIHLENELYGIKIHLATVKADNYGRFYKIIHHLPEVPRKPTCGDLWKIRAIQPTKDLEGSDSFAIIPWITFENTFAQNDPRTWQTTKMGYVKDTIMVYGHGFLPSKQKKWDPYGTVYVEVVYTDVAPLESWSWREVFNGTGQFNWDNLAWYPRLSEKVLATVKTDENGYWKAKIQIPQSFGGLHAIYAREVRLETERGKPGPISKYTLVRSGWPECTGVLKEAQAVIFDVWPTIKITPSTALTDQYVTITGEGLPLPKYYELWINEEPVVEDRDWCLVLDFGPYEQWVNKRIRNNEFDLSWAIGVWYPFSLYSPDPAMVLESPVWKGKLTSITMDFAAEYELPPYELPLQFHIGSKYLKVPVLPANNYEVYLYYFDKNTGDFVKGDHDAKTWVDVLKDPLNINVEVGGTHFPGEVMNVFVHVDVDGIAADATTLSLELYKGDTLIATLTYNKVSTGVYVATFPIETGEGDYFVKATASKDYETFTLYGSAAAGFTVTASLEGYILDLNNTIADVVIPDLGQIKLDLSTVNFKLVDITDGMATIEGDMGTLTANVSDINVRLVALKNLEGTVQNLDGNVADLQNIVVKINTTVGELERSLDDLQGVITVKGDIATIQTELGEIKGKVVSIEGTLEGKLARIETDIGNIYADTNKIRYDVGLQPVTIGLSLIAALAAIIAAALILRKVYLQ